MNAVAVIKRAVRSKTDVTLLARVRNVAGQPITQASLTALAYSVYDLTALNALVTSGTFAVASSIFDALQLDPVLWPIDPPGTLAPGYNFRARLPGPAAFPLGGRTYRCEVVFTPADGTSPFPVIYDLPAAAVLSL